MQSPLAIWNTGDIARAIGVTRSYVRRLHRNGQLPSPLGISTSRRLYYSRDAITVWIDEGTPDRDVFDALYETIRQGRRNAKFQD